MIDGNDIWESLFGILKGNVPEELTEDVLGELASWISRRCEVEVGIARTVAFAARNTRPAPITPPEVGGELVERKYVTGSLLGDLCACSTGNDLYAAAAEEIKRQAADLRCYAKTMDVIARLPDHEVLPEWRCVNCKTVVAGHLKPDRCPECNWCTGFAEVALSTPEVVDGTAGLVEALEQIEALGSDGEHSGDRHARCRDIARTTLSQHRGVSNQVVRASAQEGTALSSQATEPQASPPCGLQSTDAAEITAAQMGLLLIDRVRERRDMRDKMPGDVNATLTLELAALVCSLNDIFADALRQTKAEAKS